MRWVFWVLGLFALAVGVALALRFNAAGYALVVRPPFRIELSLNLLLLLFVLAVVGVHLLLRFIFGAIELPQRVREFRERRRREHARVTMLEALRAFFEGRFGKAEKAAASAIEMGETPVLGAVLAAHAAHELRHYAERDGYLARAEELAPGDAAMRIIAEAEMLLDERRYLEALTALERLPEKHTAGLRLELKAHQQARNWEQTIPLIGELERRSVFDAEQARQLRRHAYAENLKRKPDKRALDEGALEAEWDSELLAIYGDSAVDDPMRCIARAEKWLETHPQDPLLLWVLGRLCARMELWGKAQSYLDASISLEPTYSAHLALGQLHDRLGSTEAARRHYRSSLELAVEQLREASGGQRKVVL
jgi:HemY protein